LRPAFHPRFPERRRALFVPRHYQAMLLAAAQREPFSAPGNADGTQDEEGHLPLVPPREIDLSRSQDDFAAARPRALDLDVENFPAPPAPEVVGTGLRAILALVTPRLEVPLRLPHRVVFQGLAELAVEEEPLAAGEAPLQ